MNSDDLFDPNDNKIILERIKKSLQLLDNVENTLQLKIEVQINDMNELNNKIIENSEIFKSICQNLIKQT